ncbi:hypothetical protein JKF63_04569 [Porcisia hertigi]|uniref:Secretory carrier membrane protein n=1 Tax=Porcisia hertigi TaxID=2761500 RepID=A0A836I1C2_9TRYP|nr:hypothetical protein JKF63_04569 [Porcisia hertigi]
MFQGSSETQELRALYNFAADNFADADGSGEPSAEAYPRASNGGDEAPEYSPREEEGNGNTTIFIPVFGDAEDASVVATAVSAVETKKSKGSKSHVLKEVLGMNRTDTKGMTEEQKKAASLEQRWKNALLEEQRLKELEQHISRQEVFTAESQQAPNFPRKFLCISPLVYHSMSMVPEHRQLFVKMAFCDWVALCVLLVLNCAIAIGINFAPVRSNVIVVRDIHRVHNGVLAVVYLIGIPLSFVTWYWRIYKACSTGRPAQHILALCGLLISLAQAIFAFIGPHSYGVCGIAFANWIDRTRATGVVAPVAIMAGLWGAQAIFTCFMLVKVFIYYRKDLAARRAARRHRVNVTG